MFFETLKPISLEPYILPADSHIDISHMGVLSFTNCFVKAVSLQLVNVTRI